MDILFISLFTDKHPVSLLNEFCGRKKIGVPQYDCEEKEGAGRRKLFLFSVSNVFIISCSIWATLKSAK